MKKKMLSIMLSGVLAFSTLALTACGGSEQASAPVQAEAATEEVAEEEVEEVEEEAAAEDETEVAGDEVTDDTWNQLQDLYASLTEAYNATVDMYNDDSIEPDANIEEALATSKELMEELGAVDRAEVLESEAEDYVDAMLAVNDIFAAVIDTAQVVSTAADEIDYTQIFKECYAGITDDENTYAYLAFGDSIGALMFYNTATNESGSFVGEFTLDENTGAITIADESLNATMTFTVEEGDGGYYLDMGDDGAAFVGECTSEDFVAAMKSIAEGAVPQF